jgi:hypothetical protein
LPTVANLHGKGAASTPVAWANLRLVVAAASAIDIWDGPIAI